MPVDFTPTAADYTQYRRPFPAELLRRLVAFGVGSAGQRVLDVGSGTGLFAMALAEAGARVVAADVSEGLLRCVMHPALRKIAARAEALPFADDCFDAVTAAQCWHWFDRRTAPQEVFRVLRKGGVLAVVYQMYLPLPGNVAEATERLILRFDPKWRHASSVGINGQVLRDMQLAGFEGIESFSFDRPEPFSSEQWRGFIRSTSAVGGSMPPERVAEFDQEHAVLLLQAWPSTLVIPHRVFAAVARKPR